MEFFQEIALIPLYNIVDGVASHDKYLGDVYMICSKRNHKMYKYMHLVLVGLYTILLHWDLG